MLHGNVEMEISVGNIRLLNFKLSAILMIILSELADVSLKKPTKSEETTTVFDPQDPTSIANAIPYDGFLTTTSVSYQDPTSIANVIPYDGFITTNTIANTEFPSTNPITELELITDPTVTPTTARSETEHKPTTMVADTIAGTGFFTTNVITSTTSSIPQTVTEKEFTNTEEPTSIANLIPNTGISTTNAITILESQETTAYNQMNTTHDIVSSAEATAYDNNETTSSPPLAEPENMIANGDGVRLFEHETLSSSPNSSIEVASSGATTIASSNSERLSSLNGLQLQSLSSLLDSVLNDYDQRIRPRKDQTRRVTIFSDFVPQSIIEFDTQLQSFSVMGYFKMDWRDDFLKWDSSDFDQTEILRVPAKSVWLPKLVVYKGQDGHGLVGDRDTDIVLINHKGYVRWFPEGIYSVVCQITIKFYPFDSQICTFTYFVADEDNSTINLKHYGDGDLSEYIDNAEWKLVNLTVDGEQIDQIYFINFHFKVERRGGFAMFTLIVPVLMLSLLGGATFLIPIESGEKCSFSVTIFLAYGVFETIVIDTLPHNSLDVSYFIIYLTSMLIVSTLLTFYTILQAKIFDLLGNKEFRMFSCGRHNDGITWGILLQKLDTYIFIAFIIVVLGCTSTVLTALSTKIDLL